MRCAVKHREVYGVLVDSFSRQPGPPGANAPRGAVWKMQSEVSARRELVLNGRYRYEHNPRVHETWLGQLWRWMTRAELPAGGGSVDQVPLG